MFYPDNTTLPSGGYYYSRPVQRLLRPHQSSDPIGPPINLIRHWITRCPYDQVLSRLSSGLQFPLEALYWTKSSPRHEGLWIETQGVKGGVNICWRMLPVCASERFFSTRSLARTCNLICEPYKTSHFVNDHPSLVSDGASTPISYIVGMVTDVVLPTLGLAFLLNSPHIFRARPTTNMVAHRHVVLCSPAEHDGQRNIPVDEGGCSCLFIGSPGSIAGELSTNHLLKGTWKAR